MNTSKEFGWKIPKEKRLNLRVLTQVRQNFEDTKGLSIQFRSTNYRTPRVRKQLSNQNISKKTLSSFKNIIRKNGGWLPTSSNLSSSSHVEVVKEEIEGVIGKIQGQGGGDGLHVRRKLEDIFQIGEMINQSFYNYKFIQNKIKTLNERVRELKSQSCQFYCYTISGLILFQYSSLSLTIFYFDKALKLLANKNLYTFDLRLQLLIYKHTAKLFLQAHKLKQSREMAYMYLRKCWRYRNVDEEISAYDLLGQIELEEGNIEISRYFHWRMCHNVREEKEILQMSNQELEKNEHIKMEYSVYEDIMQFVRQQQQIVGILSNHFRSQAEEQAKGFLSHRKNRHIFMYTHRSSNRVLRNHRVLERKLIDQKQSKQLHFIRSKDLKKLHKLITQWNCFVFDLKKSIEIDEIGIFGTVTDSTKYLTV